MKAEIWVFCGYVLPRECEAGSISKSSYLLALNSLPCSFSRWSFLPCLSVQTVFLLAFLSFPWLPYVSSPSTEWITDSCTFVVSFSTVCLTWTREISSFWRATMIIRPVQLRKASHYKVFNFDSIFEVSLLCNIFTDPGDRGVDITCLPSKMVIHIDTRTNPLCFLPSWLWDFYLFLCLLDMLYWGIKCFFVYTS